MPVLSPDGTRVAYKKRQESGSWRLAVLNLASGVEFILPEERSVDDQVAWIDADTIAYAIPLTGQHSGEFDVWSTPADGSDSPKLLVQRASSPTVVM